VYTVFAPYSPPYTLSLPPPPTPTDTFYKFREEWSHRTKW
jgi:hypothetical protein